MIITHVQFYCSNNLQVVEKKKCTTNRINLSMFTVRLSLQFVMFTDIKISTQLVANINIDEQLIYLLKYLFVSVVNNMIVDFNLK